LAFVEVAPFICGSRFEESVYAMFGGMIPSYMDESFDPVHGGVPKGVFVAGGLLGEGNPYFELERRWKKLRERPDIDIEYFKASECERGSGQFAKFCAIPEHPTPTEKAKLDSISYEFFDLIVKPIPFDPNPHLFIFGVGVVQEEFYEVIRADPNARAVLGDDPYRLTYDFAMIECARAVKEVGKGDCVAFVCDEHETYSRLATEAYRNLKEKNPNAAAHMASFSYMDDKMCEPLQAADAAVFEVRRALNLALGQWKTGLREQFKILDAAGAMSLISRVTKEQLLHMVATHTPGEPFNLDTLMETKRNENVAIGS
jgi:hypothetical protein